MNATFDPQTVIIHLSKETIFREALKITEPPEWDWEGDIFSDIVETIINQQLSNKAAATIWRRFTQLFDDGEVTPERVLKVNDDEIRDVGVSRSKVAYIKGVSEAVVDDELMLGQLASLTDEEVINELTRLKGIGEWTAEMILIFSLNRQDVFSLGDLGLRTAVSNLYKVDRDDREKIKKISEQWKPYRSWASRYLWRILK